MNDNVVECGKKRGGKDADEEVEKVWCCGLCGCTVWRVYTTGFLECVSCEQYTDALVVTQVDD